MTLNNSHTIAGLKEIALKFPRSHLAVSATILLSMIVSACAPASQTPTPPATSAPSTGGSTAPTSAPAQNFELRVGIPSINATMDPHASIGNNPRRYGIYENLVVQDDKGVVGPGLATSWKNTDDVTWEFKLAPGRKFSDGNPVTAEDVKYSFDRATNPDLKLGIITRVGTIAKTEVVDPSTIRITTKGPDPLLLKRVALVGILEQSYVEKLGPADFALKGLGAGPYKELEYVSGDRLVLVPNEYYPVKPFASKVTIRQIPEASARVAGIKSGDLDLVSDVPLDQLDGLKNAGNQIINFNQGSSHGAFIFTNLKGEPTEDKRVRQAMNYAVDKEALAKAIFKGYTKPEAGQAVQETTFGYNPNVKMYPYDPAKAKQLLAEAGYPNGINIKMDVYATGAEVQATFLFVQNQFKDVGINASLNVFTDSATFLDRWYGRVQRANTLSASLLNSPAMDADFMLTWFRGNINDPSERYDSAEFDAAYLPTLTELDEKKRLAGLQKAIAIMHEDAPYLFLIEGINPWVATNKITNVIPRGDQEPRMDIIKLK